MFNQQQYIKEYNKNNYREFRFRVPKEKESILKDLIAIHNKSMNRLIIEALEKTYNIDLTIVESKLKQP